MKEQVDEHNSQPLYRANKNGQVTQRSVMTLNDDGTASLSMGFPVCEVSDYVEPQYETAQLIARLLNEHEAQENE